MHSRAQLLVSACAVALLATTTLPAPAASQADGEAPAVTHVLHEAAEVRMGPSEGFITLRRNPDDAELVVDSSTTFEQNVTVNGRLTVDGTLSHDGRDMWQLIEDLVAENEAQSVEIGRLLTEVTQIKLEMDALNATLAKVADVTAVISAGSQMNPADSCLDVLERDANAQSGVYYIDFYGSQSAQPVFCEMQQSGGGWTLITAQDDDNYFSTSGDPPGWQQTNADSPDNLSVLYSILGKVDMLRGPSQSWSAQYLYDDSVHRDSTFQDKWIHFKQDTSILQSCASGSFCGSGFELLDESHTNSADALTGFARSTTGQCKVDGNIHNWIWCVAQVSYYSSNCGLVTGVWADRNYCPATHMSFYARETKPAR